jgi:His/Glu/Gln/Arg/opine family amino acid ABC transporter permease subunit
LNFDVNYLLDQLPYLLKGLKMTLFISVISLLCSLIIGIVGAVVRTLRIPLLSPIVTIFVDFIRNTPLLLHIFLLYFGLPSVNIKLSAFASGCIALSLWGGAYAVENFRGGMEAVSKPLIEAGQSLGMRMPQLIRYIIVPIGFRISFPAFSNTAISVLKNSSYLTGIGLAELTFTALDKISEDFKTFEMFFAIGFLYLLLVWGLSYLFGVIEKRLDFHRK